MQPDDDKGPSPHQFEERVIMAVMAFYALVIVVQLPDLMGW